MGAGSERLSDARFGTHRNPQWRRWRRSRSASRRSSWLRRRCWGGETAGWAASGVVVRSLGRWVSVDTVAREIRQRAGLKGEVSGTYLDNGFSLLRFAAAEDRDLVLRRPWVVAGQTLAVEPWRPCFFPVEGAIRSALVWVRLPHLPVEFWSEAALRAVLRPAGELSAMDEWTAARKRMGFARVCLRISLSRPLRPGVLVQGPDGPFWQRFVYEGLDGVCLRCGCFHGSGSCSVEGSLDAEGSSSAPPISDQGGRPCLGPWLLAVRRWRPAPSAGEFGRPNVRAGAQHPSSHAPPVVPVSADGWVTPAKVARRRSPLRPAGEPAGVPPEIGPVGGGGFSLLAGLVSDSDGAFDKTAVQGKGVGASRALAKAVVFPPADKMAVVFSARGKERALLRAPGAPSTVEVTHVGPTKSKRARPTEPDVDRALVSPANIAGKGKGRRGRIAAKTPVSVPIQEMSSFSAVGSGVFLFGTGRGVSVDVPSSSGTSTRRVGGSPEPGSPSAAGSLDLTHDAAVGRLTRVLLEGQESPMAIVDGAASLDMDVQSGGAGVVETPPGHQSQ